MMNTTEILNKTKEKYENLSKKERMLVSGGFVLLLVMLWANLIQSPLSQSIDGHRAKALANDQSTESMMKQVKSGKVALLHSPDEAAKKLLKQLQDQEAQIDYQMRGVTLGLIDPKMMSNVMNQVLKSNGQIKLLSLDNLPPVSVEQLSNGMQEEVADQPSQGEHLFRHGLVMKFEGNYLETLNYLASLEKLPWKLFWGDLDYRVKKYPTAEVTVKMYTLSDHRELIGI